MPVCCRCGGMLVQDTPVATVKRGQSGDMQREYNRQRNNLERNVEALKGSIDKVPCVAYPYA